ncbi:retrovirus-related Pol polyprotein from transposon 17.6 [Trichonephila clavipes]|nr:retrovirus-related Pol polyprotein from transposon 17.6 [Trichonephila clavipes]
MALSGSLPQIYLGVQGYRIIEDKATDYAHLKQALSEQFPVIRNRSELETRFYSSSQKHNQKPSDFVYDLLKLHKILKLEMTEEKLIDHIISRLEPQILDYVEVRNPQTTSNLLQIIDKYEERFLNRKIRGSSWESRDIKPNENNRFPNRNRQENWRETRGNNRYADNSRPRREFNRFESQGVADNQRFDGRRRGGQSDHRFHNQGGRQNGSRNCAFRALWDKGAEKPFISEEVYRKYFSYRHRQETKDRVVTAQGVPCCHLGYKGLVVSRPYRYDRVKQGIIDYHIEKMLQEGTIHPIQSPYASQVVLTCKNNGLPPESPEVYRFTIDYRKLNAITKYPRYPLQVIDDLITNIPFTGIMSTLDLKSGYFQLAISPKDIEKTAFITRNGTFAFLLMPFGLSGAAPNFQKAIDIILKPVIGRFVMVYMDDVFITSPSFNEHLNHLNQDSFDKIKRALTEAPVLQLPNFTEQFNLFTDASGVGIGAVLNQNHRPIAFVFRNLNKAERNYTVPERESLRALALNSREQLILEQREDPELGHIYRYLENPDDGSVDATVCEGKFNSLPISNQLQKEGRDSLLCRLDKVFKSNGIVKWEAVGERD